MFSNIPVMKILALFYFIAAVSAQPIFFGHPKHTQIYLTSRKDTVAATVNQIPATLVKQKGVNVPVKIQVPVPVPVQVQVPMSVPVQVPVVGHQVNVPVVGHQVNVPVVGHQVNVPKPNAQYEMNKLFNEMKNSKKPFMKITMKGPAKSTSLFPDPFSLFDDNNSEHIVVHVPYNVHTHNIHHHHIQTVPVYKHIPVVKHVPVHVVKEVAIPVHLPAYKEWAEPAQAQWW